MKSVSLAIFSQSGDRSPRASGRIVSESLGELQAQVWRHRPRLVLDLDEVTLVDAGVVRFLIACEAEGIGLLHCAPYIREWMSGERGREE